MARIILSGDEVLCILNANGLIPEEVMDIVMAGDEIKARIRTSWPIFKSVRVGMRFVGFEQGQAVLQLMTNRLVDKFDWLVDRALATFPLADHGMRWEYPRLHVDVNDLLKRQVQGVEITSIVCEDGQFHIATVHSPAAQPSSIGEVEPSPQRPNRRDAESPCTRRA